MGERKKEGKSEKKEEKQREKARGRERGERQRRDRRREPGERTPFAPRKNPEPAGPTCKKPFPTDPRFFPGDNVTQKMLKSPDRWHYHLTRVIGAPRGFLCVITF